RSGTRARGVVMAGGALAAAVALAAAPVASAQSVEVPLPEIPQPEVLPEIPQPAGSQGGSDPVASGLATANGLLGDAGEAVDDALRPAAHAVHDATGGLPPELSHLAPPDERVMAERRSALDSATAAADATGSRAGACVVPLDQPEPM